MRRLFRLLGLSMLACGAHAAELPCGRVEGDVVHVDGLLDDWEGEPGLDVGGRDLDLSFTVRCNHDDRALYLAVDVRDDYFVRARGRAPAEDRVEIALGGDRLVIFPADLGARIPRRASWASGARLRGVEIAEARQPRGWAVELRVALASVAGWRPGAASVKVGVSVFDCDAKARPRIEGRLATDGTIEFAGAKDALEALLRDRKLGPADVVFDRPARFASGPARVVVAGSYLAVLSDEYVWISLPLRAREDLIEVRLIDLAGDGRDQIVVRYREAGGGGTREVLAVYQVGGEGLRRTLGVETAKGRGGSRAATKVAYVRRGRATDIVVEAGVVVGWTRETYRETTERELVPIPLAWREKRARFRFNGETYSQSE